MGCGYLPLRSTGPFVNVTSTGCSVAKEAVSESEFEPFEPEASESSDASSADLSKNFLAKLAMDRASS